jgi:hypothetical protein
MSRHRSELTARGDHTLDACRDCTTPSHLDHSASSCVDLEEA